MGSKQDRANRKAAWLDQTLKICDDNPGKSHLFAVSHVAYTCVYEIRLVDRVDDHPA